MGTEFTKRVHPLPQQIEEIKNSNSTVIYASKCPVNFISTLEITPPPSPDAPIDPRSVTHIRTAQSETSKRPQYATGKL